VTSGQPDRRAEDGRRIGGPFHRKIPGRDEPFRSAIREHVKCHTQGLEDSAIEMLVRGLSLRDIEDCLHE
jgi:hypothetical protein